jgi:DegV family protein with EDD domain
LSNISILTDSSANIPDIWVEQHNIKVIPLKIHWEDETLLDGKDITPAEFYKRMEEKKSIPTTSQPSIQDFLQAYESLADESDGIVVPLISSGISGTVASAQAAAALFNRVPVEIIDTKITSTGLALATLAAIRTAQKGKSLQEVKQAAEDVVNRLKVYFAVDTLEYLHRGGRINTASRYLGTTLNIKPILYFNSEGKIDALEKVRTKRKALQRMVDLAEQEAEGRPVNVAIMHANVPQDAHEFSRTIEKRLNCKEIHIIEFSPVIGVHVGPGTIGIAFYADNH